jgi:5-methylcytosine-specific restriction protein B
MNTIKTIRQGEISNGTYGCEIGVTVDEWISILSDEKLTTRNIKEVLLAFYNEPGHKATCKQLSEKEYGNSSQSSKFSSLIVHFGKAVIKHLNRFIIQQSDNDEQSYWNVAMNPGKSLPNGTFQWTIRKELAQAIEKKWVTSRFSWIPFYEEFAKALLKFRTNRKPLLKLIYDNRKELLASYLHDEGGEEDLFDDIDPFTVMGVFNRQIKPTNRISVIEIFKKELNIAAPIPNDFDGIPVLNNQKSHFFGFRSNRSENDIENLWELFSNVVNDLDWEEAYNNVINQYIIKVNITMGLFWIRPKEFLALDKINRNYLREKYNINLPNKAPLYEDYVNILSDIKKKMSDKTIEENSFYEISSNANNIKQDDYVNNDGSYYDDIVRTWKRCRNLVLYGAPGTGKTYDIPQLVVRLCTPSFDADSASRKEIIQQYKQLKDEKRVSFTSFHQSMDYEDWLEGLRPEITDDKQITYDVKSGIFKELCEEAERPIISNKKVGISSDAVVWKVSLLGTGDNPVRTDCMKNGYIRIGWDDYGPTISDETDWSIYEGESTGRQILEAFIYKMKEGDIIMSCYSNKSIDAIGVVTGGYEFLDSLPNYKRVRRVNWLIKGIDEDIVQLNDGKTMTLGTVYRLNSITLDKVKTILDKYKKPTSMEENTKPYVMVIDEFNRGNVSKIFGELITLLEADKRKGCENEEQVILPYSRVPFQIPSNVFIIATMNTADRSLGSLDYAIRRRFVFIANKPFEIEDDRFDASLFRLVSELFVSNYDEYKDSGFDQNLRLIPAETLSDEYKPEDVWIGHSYFIMKDEEGNDISSDRIIYEIIPLLEEYIRDGILTEEARKTIDDLLKIANE